MSSNKPSLSLELLPDYRKEVKALREDIYNNRRDWFKKYIETENIEQKNKAFFNLMHAIQCARSEVTLLSDFKTSAIPQKLDANTSLQSDLDNDIVHNIEAFNLEHEKYLEDKARLYQIRDFKTQQILNEIMPQILLFVSEWFPLLFTFIRYIYPNNRLDESKKSLNILKSELENYDHQLVTLESTFTDKWHEYLNMSDSERQILTDKQSVYKKMYADMDGIIYGFKDTALIATYNRFKKSKTQDNIRVLCETLAQCKVQSLMEGSHILDNMNPTLRVLYPTIEESLESLETRTLYTITGKNMLEILSKKVTEIISKNDRTFKNIQDKRKENIALHDEMATLKPTDKDYNTNLTHILKKIQDNERFITQSEIVMLRRNEFTSLFKHFQESPTGTNLRKLYLFCNNNKIEDYRVIGGYLESLYNKSLSKLALEQDQLIMTLDIRDLKDIKQLLASTPIHPSSINILTALNLFIDAPHWGNLESLETAITSAPQYYKNNPQLQTLIAEIMTLFADSLEPNLKVNLSSTSYANHQFFSSQKDEYSAKKLIAEMNYYKHHANDSLSNDEQWERINTILNLMSAYYDVHKTSPIVDTHEATIIAILGDIKPPFQSSKIFEAIKNQLHNLSGDNPIRIAAEFVISTMQDTTDYVSLDTQFLRVKLSHDLESCIKRESTLINSPQEKIPSNFYKWRLMNSILGLFNSYLKVLNEHASDSNLEERINIDFIVTHLTDAMKITRDQQHRSKDLTVLLRDTIDKIDLLQDKDIRKAAELLIETLQSTDQYPSLANTPPQKGHLRDHRKV